MTYIIVKNSMSNSNCYTMLYKPRLTLSLRNESRALCGYYCISIKYNTNTHMHKQANADTCISAHIHIYKHLCRCIYIYIYICIIYIILLGSFLQPKYRDCTTSINLKLYLMCSRVILIKYIHTCLHTHIPPCLAHTTPS